MTLGRLPGCGEKALSAFGRDTWPCRELPPSSADFAVTRRQGRILWCATFGRTLARSRFIAACADTPLLSVLLSRVTCLRAMDSFLSFVCESCCEYRRESCAALVSLITFMSLIWFLILDQLCAFKILEYFCSMCKINESMTTGRGYPRIEVSNHFLLVPVILIHTNLSSSFSTFFFNFSKLCCVRK